MNVIGYEAECSRCGETFVPDGPDDLVHIVRADGVECGGQGVMRGAWGTGTAVPSLVTIAESILKDDGPNDYVEAAEEWRRLLTPTAWGELAVMLGVCPVHVCDAEICADDEDDCPAGRGEEWHPVSSGRVWVSIVTYADDSADVEMLDAEPGESFRSGLREAVDSGRVARYVIREGDLNGGDSAVVDSYPTED